MLASLLVLGALPLYFGIRAVTRDPVFNALDALDVPDWAATEVADGVSGSRWCLIECRFRERVITSERHWEETAGVYRRALAEAGWRPWQVALCPADEEVEGDYTCWRRDELTLDLWVRPPACVADIGLPTTEPGSTDTAECDGSLVSVKVRNAIADDRTGPSPSISPSPFDEDPYPIFTDEPLEEPTSAPR